MILRTRRKAEGGGRTVILKASSNPHRGCSVGAGYGTLYDAADLLIASLELKDSKRKERTGRSFA
jgi:hypothetical protein